MKISVLRLFLCTFVATAFSLPALAQTAAGQIKAAKVEGQVMKLTPDGNSVAIKNGDLLTESDTITTGKSSGIVLVFMNGSSVKLGAESRLAIDEFKMDPLAEDISAATLKAEPSVSKTALNLSYGEMVGDVKKLNASSSYSIKTPVGAAGIRGTIYRIVFRPTADGKAFFSITTAEGLVVMTGVIDVEVPIEAGKEVEIIIDTNNPSNPEVNVRGISPAGIEAINAAESTIREALQDAILSTPGGSAPLTQLRAELNPLLDTPLPQLTPGAGD